MIGIRPAWWKVNRLKIIGLILIVAFSTLALCVLYFHKQPANMIILAFTGAIIVTISIALLITPIKPDDFDPKDINQVNVTIIAGIFIFLTITTTQNAMLPLGPIHLNPKSVIFGLATVTSIPLVVSTIILIAWANKPIGEQRLPGREDSRSISGKQLGVACTIVGLVWLIMTMLFLFYFAIGFHIF